MQGREPLQPTAGLATALGAALRLCRSPIPPAAGSQPCSRATAHGSPSSPHAPWCPSGLAVVGVTKRQPLPRGVGRRARHSGCGRNGLWGEWGGGGCSVSTPSLPKGSLRRAGQSRGGAP